MKVTRLEIASGCYHKAPLAPKRIYVGDSLSHPAAGRWMSICRRFNTHCGLDCLVYRADLNCLRALGRSDFLESRSEVTELAVRATQRPHGEMRQARLLGFLYQATGVIQTVQHDTQPDFAEIFIRRTSRSAPMPVVVDDDDPARAHARPQVR
jgi:hypothetical protein